MSKYTRGVRGENIYSRYHSPNGGISGDTNQVTVVGPNVPELQPVTADAPAVVIGETTPGYIILRPAEDPPEGRTSYMASGAYVAPLADHGQWEKLFGTHGAIPLHDHTETWAHYNSMD